MPEAPHLEMRSAGDSDVEMLCRLNQLLKDDEQSRMRLPWDQLVLRLRKWLGEEGYEAVLFSLNGETVAYMIYHPEPDPCAADGELMYLRQFFVIREHRRKGLGRSAFEMWKRERVPEGMPIELDVLESNPSGRAFWEAVGLSPRMTRMRQESP